MKRDIETMGISETRKMIRVENQIADHPDREKCDVLFIEDNLILNILVIVHACRIWR